MELIDPEPIEKYVLSLECSGGGFCFYQLDEPNLADTLFAVGALAVLNNDPATIPKTIAFTRSFFEEMEDFSQIIFHVFCSLTREGGST